MALDELSRRYGKAPHEWMALPDALFAFDWAVMEKARTLKGE